MASAPPPSEEAIAAHAAREAASAEEAPKVKGKPGPKPGAKKAGGSTVAMPGALPADKIARWRKVGYEIADLIITGGMTLGGEDWTPKKVLGTIDGKEQVLYDERSNLREAWADMAEEYQWERFPAWLACTIATLAYAAPRITAPSTQARVSKLRLWWDARKLKKQEEDALMKKERERKEAEAKKAGA